MKTLKLLTTLLIVAGSLPAAYADVVRWTVRGTVLNSSGPTQALPFAIANGEGFVLTLTLDTALFNLQSSNNVSAWYDGGFQTGTLQFANGSVPFTFRNFGYSLQVTNDRFNYTPSGITQTDALSASLAGQVFNNFSRFVSFSSTRTESGVPTVLSSTAIPTESESEAMFLAPSSTAFFFSTDIAGRHYAEVRGNVTSLEVTPIPLPGAAGLFSLALLCLARIRRQRSDSHGASTIRS